MEPNEKIIKKALLVTAFALCFVYIVTLNLVSQLIENKVMEVKEENALLSKRVEDLAEVYAELSGKPTEVIRREVVRETSQDELLTQAVGRVSKSVVSIVVSKNVPQLEIVYVNPFGNDPFFQNFGIKIPQYRQKGTALEQTGAGTGFIVSPDGFVITNRHVTDTDPTAQYTVLLSDGSQKPAQLVYKDTMLDIALLKISSGVFQSVPLGDSNALKLGQSVFAIGNALGEYNNSVSVGIISGLNRNIEASGGSGGVEKLEGVIQTDAAINPGNSGGPLVDFSGRVVGVNVAVQKNAENIGFAIPVNKIKNIINTYTK